MSNCLDLIGLRYRLGADGSQGEIDCIHLVYEVLRRCDIATPGFQHSWYEASTVKVCRDLLGWGYRIEQPAYDGDVLLLKEENWAFAVTWQTGILYVNSRLGFVTWAPVSSFTNYHCFRTKGS